MLIIEAWGRGTIKIINECKKAGLPEPIIEYSSGGISVTIFKDIFSKKHLLDKGLNERQVEAVLYTKENGKITNSIYRGMFNLTEKTAFRDFEKLMELGLFKKEGERRGTFYTLDVRNTSDKY